MARWSRYLLELTAVAVVLTGNCFVCAFAATPALAAVPGQVQTIQQCDHGQAENSAGTITAHNDPGPFFSGDARRVPGGCPMSNHNETQPATERPEALRAVSTYGSVSVAALTAETEWAAPAASFSANISVRAGPAVSAPDFIGTTVKKE